MTDLTAHRTLALRDAVASSPLVAFAAMLYALVLETFYTYSSAASCVGITVRSNRLVGYGVGLNDTPSAKAINERHEAWSARLPDATDAVWDALAAFDADEQAALFAHCVSFGVDAIWEPATQYDQGRVSARAVAARIEHSHILVKPTRADIMTNIVINTNRRTYHLELRATPATYMASVSWSYPEAELIALRTAEAERERVAPVAAGLDLAALNFRYSLSGDKADWRPVRVFDDGRQIFIEFGDGVATGDMPPLFAAGKKGEAVLLNYRVHGRFMIVDRLFERGELRLGAGRAARKVIIERTSRARGRS